MIQKVKKDPHDDGPEYTKGTKGYIWYETTVFTAWDHSGLCQVLCIDTPSDCPTELQRLLARLPAPLNFRDPFAMHASLLDQLVVYCDISVWRVRDPVRQLEKSRLQPGEVFEPTHEYSRHAIHVSEVLDSVVETLTEMQRCRTEIHKRLSDLDQPYKEEAMEYAQFQMSLMKNLKRRSDSNRARLVDEINLAFNSLARQDNDFMKSIALLTMVFLPATFITAFFSTTFFSYGENDQGWRVSGQLWVYWAVMVPATVVIMSLWAVWLAKGGKTPSFHKMRLKFPFRRFPRTKASKQPKPEAAQV
ncbi:uncharacterized protein C8A04DRAFT_33030 [Dichotomopilus funicola]|uniref:Uncharacterized protein n=1 Tax=Dichotomopilus funicola TaxID=1934379 RepID=A0AAN6UV30_9PEZI|nr:hypothetical protein C8A04DRAFT_33030 [Dichotomopilus funicola]